ncbi:hypothetical protein SDRG_04544 [Saprolegnia diclina VS20]|uniref:SAP domain-containing protein n=1 Tax=Saprolegnia diclina (strain VS20) TaxID=1156394 RepID=T0QJB7_SAPDV|nr:hypothetical protein SDRG_04544 [Saprolegnia diclina VS20]EQC38114.1 hypothetical protein SDRG_04544 [Saprolegnia diclina VS20]|eukprot:XP_008608441.1 hypothetical protein SDRG_04544 [Saprolegnia diclina VS20]
MSGKGDAAAKKAKSSKRNSAKGGSRKFVTSFEEMEARNKVEEVKQEKRRARRDDDEEGSSDEEGGADGDLDVVFEEAEEEKPAAEAVRAPKPKGVQSLIQVQNPNLQNASNKVMKAKDMVGDAEPQQLTRREREAIEKEAKAAAYMKRHLAGETAEAKKDLSRLEEVRKRREDAARRKKEEEEAEAAKQKKASKTSKVDDDDVLDARAIKALKPNVLKDKLKERGLSIQGQKNDLIQRLIDYENEKAL